MSLQNASVVIAPTSFAPVGGTALAFQSLGVQKDGSVILYVPADTDLRTRRTILARIKSPVVNASSPNGYTQARAEVTFFKPKLLANGKVTTNKLGVFASYDFETTPTETQELLDIGGQILTDPDFVSVFKSLSLA
jgi:hypothetical protein